MSLINKAVEIALRAHKGQQDRAGQPYILHPLRLMTRMDTEEERLVAVLHDVVEDSEITLDELRDNGFPEEIVQAVDALTKREGENYDEQVQRASVNPLAKKVKLADLEDNMDLRRQGLVEQKDLERLNKYLKAWRKLTEGV